MRQPCTSSVKGRKDYVLTDTRGTNPFSKWQIDKDGRKVLLSEIYPTYDWVNDDGRNNMGNWIEAAAEKAGR